MLDFSGVAVFIRTSFAHEDNIRIQEIIKGRLLHVRIYPSTQQKDPGCSVDVLCAYQHAGDDERAIIGGRQQFWTSLSRSLSTMPRRDLLIVAGDFNCTPPATSGLTGTGHLAPDRFRADACDFQEIIRRTPVRDTVVFDLQAAKNAASKLRTLFCCWFHFPCEFYMHPI